MVSVTMIYNPMFWNPDPLWPTTNRAHVHLSLGWLKPDKNAQNGLGFHMSDICWPFNKNIFARSCTIIVKKRVT
jgi:hypothetical protein